MDEFYRRVGKLAGISVNVYSSDGTVFNNGWEPTTFFLKLSYYNFFDSRNPNKSHQREKTDILGRSGLCRM